MVGNLVLETNVYSHIQFLYYNYNIKTLIALNVKEIVIYYVIIVATAILPTNGKFLELIVIADINDFLKS